MLKSVEKLVNAAKWEARMGMQIGNHSYNKLPALEMVKFAYHGNVVCYWNLKTNTFKLDDCGWKGYPSTTRTLNSYKNLLTDEFGAHEEA